MIEMEKVMNEGDNKKKRNNSPNSIESYKEMKASGATIKQADVLYWIVAELQPITARGLEDASGYRPSSVTARINELLEAGRLKVATNIKSPHSNMTVGCYTLPEWKEVVN